MLPRGRELCSEMRFTISSKRRHGSDLMTLATFRKSTINLCLVPLSPALFAGEQLVQNVSPLELQRLHPIRQRRDLTVQPFHLGGKR